MTLLKYTALVGAMLASSAAFAQDSTETTKKQPLTLTVVTTVPELEMPPTVKISESEETATATTPKSADKKTDKKPDLITDEISSGEAVSGDDSDDDATKNIQQKDGKRYTTMSPSAYANAVNSATWSPQMKVNTAMTAKLQVLLDWNHASPGPIDGGWGMNSKKALINFQKIKGLKPTGKMDEATWKALTKDIDKNEPAIVGYTITKEDVATKFGKVPESAEDRSKLKGLYYENIVEMLGERFHMDVAYLKKLNPNAKFVAGETITVINTGKELAEPITRVHASIADKTLYAYNGDKLVAAYPTTIGSIATATPNGSFKVVNKVKNPWYKATVGKDTDSPKTYMLPPGPNSPVGVVWLGLSKPSYGIHGSPLPEGISRQSSLGCVRLTNWDVLEVYANIKTGATVEIK